MRLKRIAVDHIHRTVKQIGDIIFYTGVIENGDVSLGSAVAVAVIALSSAV
jgi:hypothetical protein